MRCSVGCLCRALVVVAVVSLLSGAAPSDPMCARPNGAAAWTTTWAAAPAAAVPGVGQGYAGHTFRNVVHPTVSGRRVRVHLFSVFGRNALARLGWDVLDRSGARTVIVFEGINDIQQAPQQSDPERIIAGLGQLIEQSRARGLRVVGATILPWQGWVTWTPQREATRQAVNAWIRTGGAFDAVVDLDAATRDPAHPLRLLPLYDSGDHLHPNDAGNAAIADAVALSEL